MTHNHFLKVTFFDRAYARIKSMLRYFPVWRDLLFLSFVIIVYLVITVIIGALPRYAETVGMDGAAPTYATGLPRSFVIGVQGRW